MAAQMLTPTTLSTTNLYGGPTDTSATPMAPAQDMRTQYTGSIGAQPTDPTSGAMLAPPPPQTPDNGSELASRQNGTVSGYPSMTPAQAYNTNNFYYGDAPGGGGS